MERSRVRSITHRPHTIRPLPKASACQPRQPYGYEVNDHESRAAREKADGAHHTRGYVQGSLSLRQEADPDDGDGRDQSDENVIHGQSPFAGYTPVLSVAAARCLEEPLSTEPLEVPV